MAGLVRSVDLKRNTTNRKIIALLFVFTGILSVGLWLKGRKQGDSLIDPYKISFKVENKHVDTTHDVTRPTTELIAKLKEIVDATEGEYSIYVYRLNEGKGYGFSETQVLPAASMMKVPIMAAVYKEIEKGTIQLTDGYILKSADIRTGSGPIEFMATGTSLKVEYLLKVMGQNSDNTAPVALAGLIGKTNIQAAIKSLGMTATSYDDNTTTAMDLTEMWKNLWSNKFLTEESKQLMWGNLQNSIYEDRLPLGLPEGTIVIHKVGSGENVWADTGIVMAPEPFVISILNDNVKIDEAKVVVPKLTKAVWEYEISRPKLPSPTPTVSQSK